MCVSFSADAAKGRNREMTVLGQKAPRHQRTCMLNHFSLGKESRGAGFCSPRRGNAICINTHSVCAYATERPQLHCELPPFSPILYGGAWYLHIGSSWFEGEGCALRGKGVPSDLILYDLIPSDGRFFWRERAP